jgi:predicted flavoprotein YhiN
MARESTKAARKPGGKGPSRTRLRERALGAAAAVDVPSTCDVCVCGGGASGLVAAIVAAEAGARVVVVERALECGRTILATGNGRCNFANEKLDPARYNHPEFVAEAAGEAWVEDVLRFFADCGLAWACEEGRLYPLSRQAASVREVLLARASKAGVVLACGREVAGVTAADGGWDVAWTGEKPVVDGRLRAGSVVVACGGAEVLSRSLDLPFVAEKPVLCALACTPETAAPDLVALDGRRAHVLATLLRDGSTVFVESGEVLFRPYGISGIVTFDLSRRAKIGDVVSLDLTCGMSDVALASATPSGVLDPTIAAAFDAAGLDPLATARDLRLVVTGTADETRAQVTRGGLDVTGFSPATLEATSAPGLFACGEALDVDADCGGFNLAWAWRSGQVAGAAAAARAIANPGKELPSC